MGKQIEIPGTERLKIQEIEDAADAYRVAKKERVRLTELEVTARATLQAALEKHGLTVYRDDDDGWTASIDVSKKTKVTEDPDGGDGLDEAREARESVVRGTQDIGAPVRRRGRPKKEGPVALVPPPDHVEP